MGFTRQIHIKSDSLSLFYLFFSVPLPVFLFYPLSLTSLF